MVNDNDLIGSWHLRSWTIRYANSDKVALPFGEAPRGIIMYSADGWMSAAIGRRERPALPQGLSPREMPAEVLSAAWQSYFHYAGTWHINGDSVIHSVSQSLNPNMVGTEQLRQIALGDGTLTLSGVEALPGGERYHQLQWQREAIGR
jgi:hypothetical protein